MTGTKNIGDSRDPAELNIAAKNTRTRIEP